MKAVLVLGGRGYRGKFLRSLLHKGTSNNNLRSLRTRERLELSKVTPLRTTSLICADAACAWRG
jgi:hypothetical protein